MTKKFNPFPSKLQRLRSVLVRLVILAVLVVGCATAYSEFTDRDDRSTYEEMTGLVVAPGWVLDDTLETPRCGIYEASIEGSFERRRLIRTAGPAASDAAAVAEVTEGLDQFGWRLPVEEGVSIQLSTGQVAFARVSASDQGSVLVDAWVDGIELCEVPTALAYVG